jgi:hypothetical protein
MAGEQTWKSGLQGNYFPRFLTISQIKKMAAAISRTSSGPNPYIATIILGPPSDSVAEGTTNHLSANQTQARAQRPQLRRPYRSARSVIG